MARRVFWWYDAPGPKAAIVVCTRLRRLAGALVAGIDVFGIASITRLVAFPQGEPMPVVDPIEVMGDPAGRHAKRCLDLADVVGQVEAKWVCEVAAAGRHHMIFRGHLESARPCSLSAGLLADLDLHDSLEVSAVHSVAGFNLADELITRPPDSDPHHSASVASIVGGGQRMARRGTISCAYKACYFWTTPQKPNPSTGIRVRTDSALYLVTRGPHDCGRKRRSTASKSRRSGLNYPRGVLSCHRRAAHPSHTQSEAPAGPSDVSRLVATDAEGPDLLTP